MTTFIDLVAGTTTTTGPGTYDISGSVDGFRPFSVVANSTEVAAYVSMGSEYELVIGVVGSTGTTLTRPSVIRSSNSDAVVNWGAGTKTMRLVADSAMLQQWAKVFVNKPPGEPILLVSTGQSDTAHWNIYESGQPAYNPRVFDWSTAGTGTFDYATSTRAWRQVDPTDEYVDYAVRYIGHPRKSNVESPAPFATNYALEAAKLLQILTGRDVYTINVYSTGTEIDSPTAGWLYDPGGGNSADWLADEIAAAIADAPAGVTLPSVPDIVIYSQGSSDMLANDPSGEFADQLAKFIADAEDPNRWGWAEKGKTQWVLVEHNDFLTETAPAFNGWSIAQELLGDEVRVVSAHGTYAYDNLHLEGKSAELVGLRIATSIVTGSTPKAGQGAFKATRNWVDVSTLQAAWTFEGTSGSAPASGKWNHSVAEDVLRVHKTDGNPLGAVDQSASGIGWLHRVGCKITFKENGAPANYHEYTVSGLPEDMGTYWQWDVTDYVEGGTPPTGSDLAFMHSTRKVARDGDVVALTGLPIASARFATANLLTSFPASTIGDTTTRRYSQLVADNNGKAAAMGGEYIATNTVQSTSATAVIVSSGFTSSGDYLFAECLVMARRTASNDMFVARARFTAYNSGGTLALIDSEVEDIFPVTGISVTVQAIGIFGTWRVNFIGKASETWDVKSVTRTTHF